MPLGLPLHMVCRSYCPQGSIASAGITCSAGSYREAADPVDACTTCSQAVVTDGYYCPGVGSTTSVTGTTSAQGVPCPAGKYNDPAALDLTSCPDCSVLKGNYCPAGATSPAGESCPAGSYSAIQSSAVAACLACNVLGGSECPAGSISSTGRQCLEGTFSAATGAVQACSPCSAGSYADVRGLKVS